MSEIVIRGGSVVDGTGAEAYEADVLVSDGRIAEIGRGLSAATTLDASGCVVSPGFIDIHTHYDAQVFWDPALTPSCFHGVTTVVSGNCGFTIAPTRPEFRETIALTLENVEDMNPATLSEGIPWDFFDTGPGWTLREHEQGAYGRTLVTDAATTLRCVVRGRRPVLRWLTGPQGGCVEVVWRGHRPCLDLYSEQPDVVENFRRAT